MIHNHANKSLDDIKIIISMIWDITAGMVHLHVKILKNQFLIIFFSQKGLFIVISVSIISCFNLPKKFSATRNLLVTDSLNIKVSDFGLSKVLTNEYTKTSSEVKIPGAKIMYQN